MGPLTMAHSTDLEILDIVDAHDRVIGQATRGEIHRRGLAHRAVHMFVFDPQGMIYVQRRSADKDRFPSVLDSSASGHVDPGESYHAAAVRELKEELGIEADLKDVLQVRASEITDNEHVVLFVAFTDDVPAPDRSEIQWGAFMSAQELSAMMDMNPDDFVPAFIHLWNLFLEAKKCEP